MNGGLNNLWDHSMTEDSTGNTFRNVWLADGSSTAMASECVRCGAIVHSAGEMVAHKCPPKPEGEGETPKTTGR